MRSEKWNQNRGWGKAIEDPSPTVSTKLQAHQAHQAHQEPLGKNGNNPINPAAATRGQDTREGTGLLWCQVSQHKSFSGAPIMKKIGMVLEFDQNTIEIRKLTQGILRFPMEMGTDKRVQAMIPLNNEGEL